MENGPWTVDKDLKLHDNPFSWTKVATVVWIDQPAGVGYSYADKVYVDDEAGVAKDMKTFLDKFFETYPQYANLPFYVVGESYGGKYVPTIATMILRENKAHPERALNLKGISIGNGDVSPLYQFPVQGDAAYMDKLIDKPTYEKIQAVQETCKNLLAAEKWDEASDPCNEIIMMVLKAAGNINPMNYEQHCEIQDCFVYTNITDFLNLPETKAKLGVPTNVTWQTCLYDIQFTNKDLMGSFLDEMTEILEAGLNVIAYYGDLDLVCPWNGGLNWMVNTQWSGQTGFGKAPLKDWTYNNKVVGQVKQFRNFQFVRVHGAGHMTPTDQPEVSLELFTNFIHNRPF
eukprot:TRINITY_DN1827_c0_g1_i2.p1 TRINITY_DN1827_c0_g1~~TRINITY_DN1827_c0_g1_i2.p1  ORF type:complete len:344 (+),score=88.46 TRINITY_DN1827_c0_g1_i2:311-1342(+)